MKLHSTSTVFNCSPFSRIAGLSPSTQYRVTVRAKQLRAPGQQSQQPPPLPGTTAQEHDSPGAYTDFRTLAKGLPDPPQVSDNILKYKISFLIALVSFSGDTS